MDEDLPGGYLVRGDAGVMKVLLFAYLGNGLVVLLRVGDLRGTAQVLGMFGRVRATFLLLTFMFICQQRSTRTEVIIVVKIFFKFCMSWFVQRF